MTLIRRPLVAALKADSTFAALVSTYLGEPAIFADDLAPADATMPYVLVKPVSTVPLNTLRTKGRADSLDVHAFIRAGIGDTALDAIEERLRDLFDEPAAYPTVAGYHVYSISVGGVMAGPYEPGIESRIVTLDVLMQRI